MSRDWKDSLVCAAKLKIAATRGAVVVRYNGGRPCMSYTSDFMTRYFMTPDPECLSCEREMPRGECACSERPCGHHCNHSWTKDFCHWCGFEFGEVDNG